MKKIIAIILSALLVTFEPVLYTADSERLAG